MRKILITNALTYANGPIHLGHLVGFIQADIWKRFQIMQGNLCYHLSGTDCHGVPIMLKARELGLSCEELTSLIIKQHKATLTKFDINFDIYEATNREHHALYVQDFYNKLVEKNFIYWQTIEQPFDEEANMFLADRFIKGQCPYCKAQNQDGDLCSVCNKVYDTSELLEPYSTLTGKKPVFLHSKHCFFKLSAFAQAIFEGSLDYLEEHTKNSILSWQQKGLRDWNISRDAPYYGITIPNTNSKKHFYVWFDAPLGYLSFCDNAELQTGWELANDLEIYHYVGKDIAHFHALHFIAMLKAANKRLPTRLVVNGFMNVNKQKMSKSSQHYTSADEYLQNWPAYTFRYFIASKSHNNTQDINFDIGNIINEFNTGLVNKVVNLASRSIGLMTNTTQELVTEYKYINVVAIQQQISNIVHRITQEYSNRKFSKVVELTNTLADLGNNLLHEYKPWESQDKALVQEICSACINIFKVAIGTLKPITPAITSWGEEFLNIRIESWSEIQSWLYGHKLNKFVPTIKRIVLH